MEKIHVAGKNSYTFWKDNQPDAFISRLATMGMQKKKGGVSPGTLHLGFSVINVAVSGTHKVSKKFLSLKSNV